VIKPADRRHHEKRLEKAARRDHAPAAFLLAGRMNILSIQSHVAYGHVGNAAATFPLQRIGIDVWPVHTVQFSNHTGYGDWTGEVFEAVLIGDLVEGIAKRGVLASCDGVLSGYMGSADTGAAILDAAARVKAANPQALYCCDPVIGDAGRGIFVRPGIPEFMRDQAVPAADLITPNQFELDLLARRATTTTADARAAIAAVHALGPRVILVTSLHTEETPPDAIDLVASDPAGTFRVRTPKLPIEANGAGDVIAALFFAHYLRARSAAEALTRAASSIFGLLRRTADAGAGELLLVEAQDEFVNPSRLFAAEPLQI
jgi:pyridoxine kinase